MAEKTRPLTNEEKRLRAGETFKVGNLVYSPDQVQPTHRNEHDSGLVKLADTWVYSNAKQTTFGWAYQVCSNPAPASWTSL